MSAALCPIWIDGRDFLPKTASSVLPVPVVALPSKPRAIPCNEWNDSFGAVVEKLAATLVAPGAAEEHLRLWAQRALAQVPAAVQPSWVDRQTLQLVLFESEPSVLSAKWLDASGRVVPAKQGAPQLPLFEQFSYALSSWRSLLSHAHFLNVRASLEWLLKDESIWEDEEPPKMASFKALLAFLRDVPKAVPPAITIGDNGAFAATWQSGTRRRLSIRFLDGGRAVISAVERDEQGRRARGESQEVQDLSQLGPEIDSRGLRGWLLE